MSSATTPARKRSAEEVAKTPGWGFGLFSSVKKAKPSVESSMKATTVMPRIVLSPPSSKQSTLDSSTLAGIITRAPTIASVNVGSAAAMSISKMNNGNETLNRTTGTLLPAWKPTSVTGGSLQFHMGSHKREQLRRSRYRAPLYKPQSKTLVRKRRTGNATEPFDKDVTERLLQQNKQLFPKSTLQDDPLDFQRKKVAVKRRLGSNQSASRMPPPPPTQVSHSEQQRQVSFQEAAQTPAAKSTNRPRLQRMQTPGVRDQHQQPASSVTFAGLSTPLPSANRMQQRQQTPGTGLLSTASSKSPPGSASSFLSPPSCTQRRALTLKGSSLDGPYRFPGEAQPDRTSGKSTATMPFEVLSNVPAKWKRRAPAGTFKRVPLIKEKEPTKFFSTDEDDERAAAEADTKKMKTGHNDDGTKAATVVGWGANMFPDEGSWKCSTCTARNPKEVVICKACETARDGDGAPAADGKAVAAAAPAAVKFDFGTAPKGISFGVPAGAASTTTGGISFGAPSASAAVPAPGISFGAPPAPSPGFKFGAGGDTTSKATDSTTKTPTKFSFGVSNATTVSTAPHAAIKKAPDAAPKTEGKAAAGGAKFNFGSATFGGQSAPLSAAAKPFEGKPVATDCAAAIKKDDEGSRKKRRGRDDDDDAPAPPMKFGSVPSKKPGTEDAPASFTFGSAPIAAPAVAPAAPSFSFGGTAPAPAAAATSAISFGGAKPATDATAVPPAPAFSFGAGASTSNPFSAGITPNAPPAPSFGAAPAAATPGSRFSFGGTAPPPVAATPGNSFGAAPAAPAAFGSTPAAAAPVAFGAAPGFGAPAATPGFRAPVPAAATPGFGAPAGTASFPGFGGASVPPPDGSSFGATPAPSFGASTPAPAAGGFGGTPAPAAGGFGAGGGFGAATPSAPPANNFGATPGGGFGGAPPAQQFGGGISTPAAPPAGGFSMGSSKAKTTGKRRIIRAKRPPGSANR